MDIKKLIKEEIDNFNGKFEKQDEINCSNCGWSWDAKDGGSDLFVCHKCGHNNKPVNEV